MHPEAKVQMRDQIINCVVVMLGFCYAVDGLVYLMLMFWIQGFQLKPIGFFHMFRYCFVKGIPRCNLQTCEHNIQLFRVLNVQIVEGVKRPALRVDLGEFLVCFHTFRR